jgi:hypothetical protein
MAKSLAPVIETATPAKFRGAVLVFDNVTHFCVLTTLRV